MMVDSIKNMTETKIFKATMNKASYAYRSNRPLYILIYHLNKTKQKLIEEKLTRSNQSLVRSVHRMTYRI